jgi:YD repeat-containing protein
LNGQQTCGKGLAAQAPLPATLGELTAAVGRILELHMGALDETDPAAKQEYDAYERLVAEHDATADALRATAGAMAGCIDLPMAPHDVAVMTDSRHADAFKRFIEAEERLLALLQTRLDQDRAMLDQMRSE